MKITAIISEYNPFHNGHLFQLNKAIQETTPDLKIALMSGNFTQRGIMATLKKDVRSRIAIEMGFDMVIEIPTIFAINNADLFSFGAVNMLRNFKDTTLSFGSEIGDINKLQEISDITNTEKYNEKLKEFLKDNSYPVSANKAINEIYGSNVALSNNILAIEYIKKVNEINPSITLHTVKRVNNYNNNNVENNFVSSSNLRQMQDKKLAKEFMPRSSFKEFISFTPNIKSYQNFVLSKIFSISKDDLKEIFDVTEGLENRIKNAVKNSKSYEEFINNIETKRYSTSKINRILLNTLLDIKKSDIKRENINYISVLAIKKDKLNALSYLNNYTKIISKYSDIEKLNETEKKIFEIDRKANNLYSLINNVSINENMIILD